MRIAMIGPFGLRPKGTMRVRALPLARALVARGHTVRLFMPPWHTPDEAGRRWEEEGVAFEYVPLTPHVPLLSYLCITLRLVRRALAWRPDVVHCFKPKAYAGLAAWMIWHLQRLGWAHRLRLVMDEDDWEGPGGWNDLEPYPNTQRAFFAWQEHWGLRHCGAVTVASRTLQSLAWSLGVPPSRVYYLPNGAECYPQRFAAPHPPEEPLSGPIQTLGPAQPDQGLGSTVRAQLGLGPAPVVLLYTRFFEYDVARAVAVFRQVWTDCPAARFLVVGQGLYAEDDARFDRMVREAGLEPCVVRAGWVPMSDLPGYFAAADVALYPFDDTLINRGKCSVKLLDLLIAGVSVVADAVGQNAEYIVPNESGLLVPSGDVSAMAAATLALLRDEPLRRRLGAAATARIRTYYSWQVLVERALAAYGHAPRGALDPHIAAR